MSESDPILDQYDCEHCDNTLRRKATPNNITFEDEIKFCPFCGRPYQNE